MAPVTLLGQTIVRRDALPGDCTCEVVLDLFIRDPDCLVLAVVEDGRPIGLVQRDAFMARMEAPGAAYRSIRDAMEIDPPMAAADDSVTAFIDWALKNRPCALQTGFIVTEAGRYLGVGDAVCLIKAQMSAAEDLSVSERVGAEAGELMAHALAAAEGLGRMRLPEAASTHLETITEASNRTLALLDVAAQLRAAESGRLVIAPAPCRLQDMMDEVETRWRGKAEQAGITLLVSYDGEQDCTAFADRPRLLQVFDALIGHALAHVRHGVVEASLKAEPRDGVICLTGRVRDNGAEYAPGYLDKAFKGGADAASSGGMAVLLGLVLAERAVSAMAGRLAAEANVGAGATMIFHLDARVSNGAAAEAAHAADEAAHRSAHVLVVDDNATNRMVVEALCEMFDCSTESVVDGLEAVEAAKAGRFDVILMDIKMPRMDGVSATREIRKLSGPAGRVPIIALTANADPDEVAQYLAAGMHGVVEKPIKPDRLLEALDSVLSAEVAPEQDASERGASAAA